MNANPYGPLNILVVDDSAVVREVMTAPEVREQINAVSVLYTAGYGTTPSAVPAPIRHWILLAVGEMYAERERSAEKPAVPHQFVDGLLDPYRILAV